MTAPALQAPPRASRRPVRPRRSLLAPLGLLSAVALTIISAWLIGFGVSRPIRAMSQTMRELAEGNLKVGGKLPDRQDEIREMAEAVQVFRANMIARDQVEAARQRANEELEAAKAALESTVRYLANDLGPEGIRVNAVSPGPMKTLAGAAIGGARKTFKHTEQNAPLRANATLDAVGGTAVYLASDYGASTTGEIVRVDGGFHVLGMPQTEHL